MDVKIVETERGCAALMVDGYRFVRQSVLKCGVSKWFCEKRRRGGCQAKCFTLGDSLDLQDFDLLHNHEPDVKKYTRQAISNQCKRKAEEDLYSRPSKLMRGVMSSMSDVETVSQTDVHKIRANVRNARRKTLPGLPKSLEETQDLLQNMEIKTDRQEPFLLENDYENKIVMFGCRTNVDVLKSSTSILVDGTFDYCCRFFKQLFTIFVVKNCHFIPVLFCLLADKKESTYTCLFKKIKVMMGDNVLKEVTVDFEIAIHNALRRVWPMIDIFGCRFHLTQSWFRKIQSLGLAAVYTSPGTCDGEMQKSMWLRGLFGLTFLDPEDVGASFVEDFMSNLPVGIKFEEFSSYLVDNYIENDSKFPPKMWASMSKCSTTTNNPCESFHAHFRKHFYHPHPDINVFLRALIETQTYVYIKINSIGETPRATGGRFREGQRRLENTKMLYMQGLVSRKDFVLEASKRYRK